MTGSDPKANLQLYLQRGRDALLWKLDGLPEYDIRRPMTPTGTNLLGLVKHAGAVEAGYFGVTFGRPFGEPTAWTDETAEVNADMWATPEESRQDVISFYRRAWEHSDQTIEELSLESIGRVPWWSGRNEVTLHRILVHVVTETERHAGHADIVRELIDGRAGLRPDNSNLTPGDQTWWENYRARLEEAAREAGGVSSLRRLLTGRSRPQGQARGQRTKAICG